jgi:hypothetical protein
MPNSSQGVVPTNWFQSQVLAALLDLTTSGDFSGPLVGLKVALVAADFTPSAVLAWADLTEATFSGYAESAALTWGAAVLQPDGTWTTTAAEVRFTMTATTVTNTIYGLAVFQTVSSVKTLAWTEKFASPIPIANIGNAVILAPQFGPSAESSVNALLVA